MNLVDSLLKTLNLLSIDVVLGACAGMFFFSDMMKVTLGWSIYGLLGMAVWCIYTFDHLWDAYQVKTDANTNRHRFHQRHFKLLSILLVLVALSALVFGYLMVNLDWLLGAGLVLGAVIIGSMLLLKFIGKKTVLLKEVFIAFYYVSGILLAPLWKLDFEFSPSYWMFFAVGYFLLACFNLIFLSFVDAKSDREDGHTSITTQLGTEKTRTILWVILILGTGYIPFLFLVLPSYYSVYTLIWGLMMLGHLTSFLEKTKDKEQLRRKLEALFILPFLLVFF